MHLDEWQSKLKESNTEELIFPEFLKEYPKLKFVIDDGELKSRMGTLDEFEDLLKEKSDKITLKSITSFLNLDPETDNKTIKYIFTYIEKI